MVYFKNYKILNKITELYFSGFYNIMTSQAQSLWVKVVWICLGKLWRNMKSNDLDFCKDCVFGNYKKVCFMEGRLGFVPSWSKTKVFGAFKKFESLVVYEIGWKLNELAVDEKTPTSNVCLEILDETEDENFSRGKSSDLECA